MGPSGAAAAWAAGHSSLKDVTRQQHVCAALQPAAGADNCTDKHAQLLLYHMLCSISCKQQLQAGSSNTLVGQSPPTVFAKPAGGCKIQTCTGLPLVPQLPSATSYTALSCLTHFLHAAVWLMSALPQLQLPAAAPPIAIAGPCCVCGALML